MKLYILALLFVCATITGCTGTSNSQVIDDNSQIRREATLLCFGFLADPSRGDFSGGNAVLNIWRYDREGNILMEAAYHMRGLTASGYEDFASSENRMFDYGIDDSDSLMFISTWSHYNGDSVKRKFIYHPVVGSQFVQKYSYDNGRLSAARQWKHGFYTDRVYHYDASGKLTEVFFLDMEGANIGFEKFDSTGRDSYAEHYGQFSEGNYTTTVTTTFTGDSLDYTKKTVQMYRGEHEMINEEVYENGLMVVSTSSHPGLDPRVRHGSYTYYRHEYNRQGDLVAQYDDSDRLIYRTTYEYDTMGNWVRAIGEEGPARHAYGLSRQGGVYLRVLDYYTD